VPVPPPAQGCRKSEQECQNTDVSIILPKDTLAGISEIAGVAVAVGVKEGPEVLRIIGVARSVLKCYAAGALGKRDHLVGGDELNGSEQRSQNEHSGKAPGESAREESAQWLGSSRLLFAGPELLLLIEEAEREVEPIEAPAVVGSLGIASEMLQSEDNCKTRRENDSDCA